MRADEWGGEADKLGHTNVAFLGNAVKTLEECSWVAARAYNWGRAAPTRLDFRFLAPLALPALLKSYAFILPKQDCFFHFLKSLAKNKSHKIKMDQTEKTTFLLIVCFMTFDLFLL